jgi:hypothetical protein
MRHESSGPLVWGFFFCPGHKVCKFADFIPLGDQGQLFSQQLIRGYAKQLGKLHQAL